MRKKKAGNNDFTSQEKMQILNDIEVIGNVSKVAEKYNVSRQSIYNWKNEIEQLQEEVKQNEKFLQAREGSKFDVDVIKDIESYKHLLQQIGTLEERKQNIGAVVEYNLMRVIQMLESHPDLSVIHPKDLSKIMIDLNSVRKDMNNEPAIIVEYKNSFKENVLQVLNDFLDIDQIKEVVNRIEAMDADFEIID